jgi:putative flippase GtrA
VNRLESALGAVLTWLFDHVPMPQRMRDRIHARRGVLGELVRFALAGLGATVVFVFFFNILIFVFPDEPKWEMNLIANIPAIAVSYWISVQFVFKNAAPNKRSFEITMFFVFALLAVAVQTFSLYLVEVVIGRKLGQIGSNVVVFVATAFNWSMRFVTARFLIFKSHLERPPVDFATDLAHLAAEDDSETESPTGSSGN